MRPPQDILQLTYNTKDSATQAPLLFELIHYHAILALSQKWLLTYSYLPIKLCLERVGLHSVFGYKNSFHVEKLQAARENLFFFERP